MKLHKKELRQKEFIRLNKTKKELVTYTILRTKIVLNELGKNCKYKNILTKVLNIISFDPIKISKALNYESIFDYNQKNNNWKYSLYLHGINYKNPNKEFEKYNFSINEYNKLDKSIKKYCKEVYDYKYDTEFDADGKILKTNSTKILIGYDFKFNDFLQYLKVDKIENSVTRLNYVFNSDDEKRILNNKFYEWWNKPNTKHYSKTYRKLRRRKKRRKEKFETLKEIKNVLNEEYDFIYDDESDLNSYSYIKLNRFLDKSIEIGLYCDINTFSYIIDSFNIDELISNEITTWCRINKTYFITDNTLESYKIYNEYNNLVLDLNDYTI